MQNPPNARELTSQSPETSLYRCVQTSIAPNHNTNSPNKGALTMWSAIRPAAARALCAGGALNTVRLSCMTSRVALHRTAPTYYAWNGQLRSFAATRGRPPKTPGAKPAKKGAKKRVKKAVAAKKAKPARKKKARKELSPEKKLKLKVREQKVAALLKGPSKLPERRWMVYVNEQMKGRPLDNTTFGESMARLGQSFRALSDSELQVCPPDANGVWARLF